VGGSKGIAIRYSVSFGQDVLKGEVEIGKGRKECCDPLLEVFAASNLWIVGIVKDEVGGQACSYPPSSSLFKYAGKGGVLRT
jgi:hypothetical protein